MPNKTLWIIIHNGISQIYLQANDIKEKVEWVNALKRCKNEDKELRKSLSFKDIASKSEKMNEVLVTNIFNNFEPLYTKIGQVWSTQAQLEEVVSLMEPEIDKNPALKDQKVELLELTNKLKLSAAEVLEDLEGARNDFARALQNFAESNEPIDFESEEDEIKSQGTIRSVRIDPQQNSISKVQVIEEVVQNIDEEEKEIVSSTLVKFNPKELGKIYEKRYQLPAFRDPNKKISIWTLIREFIGQDLTRVTLPIILNEPVTMLQKTAEWMENYEVLEAATQETDPYFRMAFVAIFTSIQYWSIPDRTMKPFNPLLGETYELVDENFKLFAEQVSHHPPITACHAYGRGYEYWTHTEMKSKFHGTSMEFIPSGKGHTIIYDSKTNNGEHYVSDRPRTAINNLIIGTLYLEIVGETDTYWPQTGIKCRLKHYAKGWGGRNAFLIEGTVFDEEGNEACKIKGHWNDKISATNLSTGDEILLWTIKPKVENLLEQYGLTQFAINLNHLPAELKNVIAPTDSRYRTDLRAYEEGNIELGAKEKHRLEEKQRATRKQRKDDGVSWKWLYFEEVIDEETGEKFFKNNDKYWYNRHKGNWNDVPDIF